jgi:hypothetical protein
MTELQALYSELANACLDNAIAAAEKVGCLRTAREFLRERTGSAKPKDIRKYLRRALKVSPSAEDQSPDESLPTRSAHPSGRGYSIDPTGRGWLPALG